MLNRMFSESRLFRLIVDEVEKTLTYVDLDIAREYADLVPDRLRVRAFAGLRFAVNAGFGLGSAAAGFLAKHSFAWLFYGDALTLVIFGGIALAFLPHGVHHQRGGDGYIPWSTALGRTSASRSKVTTS